MTQRQKEFLQFLKRENTAADVAGKPSLRNPSTLRQLALSTDSEAAKKIIEAAEAGKFAFIDASPADREANPVEILIWETYMGTLIFSYNGQTAPEKQSTWAIFRKALAELIEQESPFISIAQSKATNALPALVKKALQLDRLGNATAEANGVEFLIESYSTLSGVRTQTSMLNDVLLSKFSQTHSQTVELPLKEYAELRNISATKDQLKELRKEVVADLETLAAISYRCKEKINGKYVDSGLIKLNGGTAIVKNGVIRWNYNTDLIPWLERLPPINYAKETLAADPRTNAYYFSRFIDLNYRINEGKSRQDVISIRTFLSKSPNIPKIEDVKQSRNSAKKRIIIPFFRDLDSLERIYYDVIDEDGNIVDDPLSLEYDRFINCSLHIDYSEYPEHPERLKSRKNWEVKARIKREKKQTAHA